MKENWENMFVDSECPSIEELEKYSWDKLSIKRKNEISAHLDKCELCADLLEGFKIIGGPQKLQEIENEISLQLDKKLFSSSKKKITWFTLKNLSVAASILVLVMISLYFLIPDKKQPAQIAQNLPEPKLSSKQPSNNAANENVKISKSVSSDHIKTNKRAIIVGNEPIQTSDKTDLPASPAEVQKTPDEKEDLMPSMAMASRKSEPLPNIYAKEFNKRDAFLISGKITDSITGEAIPGVNIVIKGTTKGVTTGADGWFQIPVPEEQALLSISTIGYKSEEKKITANHAMDIALVQDVKSLDELVVVGYGTQLKKTNANFQREEKIKAGYARTASSPSRIDSMKRSLTPNPENRNFLVELAREYLKTKNQPQGIETLLKIRNQAEKKSQAEIDEMIQLTKESKYSEALEKLNSWSKK